MQRLKGQDAQFIYNETANSPFVTLKVMIYEPVDSSDVPSFNEFKQFVASGLSDWINQGLGFRVVRVPFDLHHPIWLKDKNFCLDNHIHHIALPEPGNKDDFCDFISYIMSHPLDPNRPLWDSWMVRGLEGGRIAWVCKMHHVLADGMMSADHIVNLHKRDASGSNQSNISPSSYIFKHAASIPNKAKLIWDGLIDLAKSYTFQFPDYFQQLKKSRADNKALTNRVETDYGPFTAPFSLLNHAGGHYLRYRYDSFSLSEFKQLSRALDCTINNLVLALCSEAMRHYIAEYEPLPEAPMVIIMPVSNRGDNNNPNYLNTEIHNNSVSLAFVPLDLRIENFLERLESIKQGSKTAMEVVQQNKGLRIEDFADFMPGSFFRILNWISLIRQKRKKNPLSSCSISNVPGPKEVLHACNGKLKMSELLSCGNLGDPTAFGVTVWSYLDKLNFSFFFREGVLPNPEKFSAYLNQAYLDAMKISEDTKNTSGKAAKQATQQ